jgi:hypothetical protein
MESDDQVMTEKEMRLEHFRQPGPNGFDFLNIFSEVTKNVKTLCKIQVRSNSVLVWRKLERNTFCAT